MGRTCGHLAVAIVVKTRGDVVLVGDLQGYLPIPESGQSTNCAEGGCRVTKAVRLRSSSRD